MPHLGFEYSRGLEDVADLAAFAWACRDALLATGECPLGGIRVRGFRADFQAIADGHDDYHFLDMVLRLGAGRDAETRVRIADQLYATAEAELRPALAGRPFILSLEVMEIPPEFSRKGWSSIHAEIAGKGAR